VFDPTNPFIGASPDGIISCLCCGKGVVEVKCPFSCKDKSLDEAVKDKAFCLEKETFFSYLKKTMHIISKCSYCVRLSSVSLWFGGKMAL